MNLAKKHLNLERRLAPPLEVRAAGEGVLTGYASVFGGPPDSYGDIIAPGAFRRSLDEHKAEGSLPAMLWAHKTDEPIGRWTELREDDKGLFARGAFNLKTQRGQDAFEHVKAGDVTGLSIGFLLDPEAVKRNPDGSKTITEAFLAEISVVTMPANRRARIELGSKSELVELLQKSGVAKEFARRIAAGGWVARNTDETPEIEALAARIQKAADRLKGK